MRVLILGCHEVTHYVAPMLSNAGHQVTVLDESPGCSEGLPQSLPIDIIQSTKILMEDMQNGHVESANVFLALANDDNLNAMATQIATHIFDVSKTVCQISNVAKCHAYQELGLNVVSSTATIAAAVLESIQGKD